MDYNTTKQLTVVLVGSENLVIYIRKSSNLID
jgi:hypothetical protein